MHHHESLEDFIKILPLVVGVAGIIIASAIYLINPAIANFFAGKLRFVYNVLLNKYYFDELYNNIFVASSRKLSNMLWKWIDNSLIDGILNSLAGVIFRFSKASRALQTGKIEHYSFIMFVGVLVIICLVIFY
jgi:NADH-quinone oxidoreductase subunit L